MKMRIRPVVGEWYDIPGYEGLYQINYKGDVRKLYKTIPPLMMKLRVKHCGGCKLVSVFLSSGHGQRKEHTIHALMRDTFFGPQYRDCVIYNRNGLLTDNDIDNLELTSRVTLGKKMGGQGYNKPIAKISRTGEIVEIFKSAKVAG